MSIQNGDIPVPKEVSGTLEDEMKAFKAQKEENVLPKKTPQQELDELRVKRKQLGTQIIELRRSGKNDAADELLSQASELDADIKYTGKLADKDSEIDPETGKKRLPGPLRGGSKGIAAKPETQVIREEQKTSWSARFDQARERMEKLGQIS